MGTQANMWEIKILEFELGFSSCNLQVESNGSQSELQEFETVIYLILIMTAVINLVLVSYQVS